MDAYLVTNAITRALINEAARLTGAIHRLERQNATEDRDFALAANRQALRHTEMALAEVSRGLAPEPLNPYPEPAAGWQESELREAFGR